MQKGKGAAAAAAAATASQAALRTAVSSHALIYLVSLPGVAPGSMDIEKFQWFRKVPKELSRRTTR